MSRLLPLALVSLGVACGGEAPAARSDLAMLTTAMPAWVQVAPDSRETFLEVFAPLPADAIAVQYGVEGPAGLHGTLEILVRPGGERRESWALSLPLPDGETRAIEGSAIQTADYGWVGEGDSLEVVRSPLGALADAYLALDAEGRARVIASVRAFRTRLAAAADRAAPPTEEILGVPCVPQRLAAQELCVWTPTGLPLRYQGTAFSLVALSIELSPSVPAGAFAVPPAVRQAAPRVELDAARSLERLVAEDYAELGPLLHPGLRLPLG